LRKLEKIGTHPSLPFLFATPLGYRAQPAFLAALLPRDPCFQAAPKPLLLTLGCTLLEAKTPLFTALLGTDPGLLGSTGGSLGSALPHLEPLFGRLSHGQAHRLRACSLPSLILKTRSAGPGALLARASSVTNH
jgi:hypothetical protein